VVTWAVVLLTFVVAYCFLEDWTVVDINDPEGAHTSPVKTDQTPGTEIEETNIARVEDSIGMIPVIPMVKPHYLRRWFPNQYQSMHHEEDGAQYLEGNGLGSATRSLPNYKMHRTQYTRNNAANTSMCAGLSRVFNQVIDLLRMRATWRVLIFGFASFSIAMNWTASEMLMPPFLERRFGEDTPIYIIQSINLIGCLLLPPIVGALTSGREDFSIVMPGEYPKIFDRVGLLHLSSI